MHHMAKKVVRTLNDFKAAHDPDVIIPAKIKIALAAIEKIGPEHYEYEQDFVKMAGISVTQLARYRDQFEAYWLLTAGSNGKASQKRVYFGNTKIVTKLKG